MRVTSGDIGADSILVDLLTREVAFHYASSVPVCQCTKHCPFLNGRAELANAQPVIVTVCLCSESEESMLDLG